MSHNEDEDILALIEEDGPDTHQRLQRHWKILIVDDDQDVHQATEFALTNTPILGRPLVFVHAYSAAQAVEKLQVERDIAVILLDVVMEREDAGLKLVKVIRDDLAITEARIILRTGQPGYAPEIDAIRDYDINDYKTKSELSRNRLYTTLTAAIRSYDQIHAINASRRGLGMIIRASAELMAHHGLQEFAAGIITQIAGLLSLPPEGLVCAHERNGDPEQTRIIAAAGRYAECIERPLGSLNRPEVMASIRKALAERTSVFTNDSSTLFFPGESGHDMAAYLETATPLNELDHQLLEVFCTNIAISLDNVVLFGQLNDHAYNDQLLGIPNRLAFVRAVDNAVQTNQRSDTVALVDIDHFSELNDALGHTYGDMLLNAVAKRLRTTLGDKVVIARVAADTFGILGCDEQVAPAALKSAFATPFMLDASEHLLSATLGLARLTEVDGGGTDAVKSANIALSRAKDGTRGDFCYFVREMELDTRNRVRLLQDLRGAFERDRLFVVYQPQLSLKTRKVVGVEALMRWRNDQGQFVPPDQFIPLAENSGMIISMGEWVLRTACLGLREFERAGIQNLRMAVNVSVSQFRHPNFIDTVDTVLSESGVNPKLLELEITESIAMLESQFMVSMIEKLKSRGIMVAIDDFGTGFSSLSYLERLKVDRLKIDRSFVSQMSTGDSSKRIVETIVQLGHSLDLEIIAEGVETDVEADILTVMGCHEGQGYLFAKPLEVRDLLVYINATNG
jgi:diguanylate cyclase (GGDEF)-like protein